MNSLRGPAGRWLLLRVAVIAAALTVGIAAPAQGASSHPAHRTCAVGDLVTHSQIWASHSLLRAGCRVRVRHDRTAGAGPQRVIAQSVPAGRAVPRSRTVTLTVGHLACRYGREWTITDESDLASIAKRTRRNGAFVTTKWRGCLKAGGLPRQVAVARSEETDTGVYETADVTLAGSWVLAWTTQSYRERFDYLYAVDLAGTRRPAMVAPIPPDFTLVVDAISTDGVVAWVQRDARAPNAESVVVKAPGGAVRTLRDGVTDVAALSIDAETVSWMEGGTPQHAPIAP